MKLPECGETGFEKSNMLKNLRGQMVKAKDLKKQCL